MKNTIKRARQENTPATTAPPADELAKHISAILNHPDTPAGIHNALGDEISSLDAPQGFGNSEEYVRLCLRNYIATHDDTPPNSLEQPTPEKKADEMKARAHAFASEAYSSALKTFYESGGEIEQAEQDATEFQSFGDYLARVVMHPQTPAALKSALQAVIVNIMSNETGYQWADDEAGLRFLIPLFLSHMNDDYATGIVHSTNEFIADSLPGELRRELMERGAR